MSAASLKEKTSSDPLDYSHYHTWANESLGVRLPLDIRVASLPPPHGRGVVANEPIPANSKLVSVPENALLNTFTLKNHSMGPVVRSMEKPLELNEDDKLALLLLFEKNVQREKSIWYEHILRLPEIVDNPFYFNEEEIAALRGTSLQPIAMRMQQQVRQDYARIFPTLFQKYEKKGITVSNFSLKEYQWAIAMIWSRFISVKINGTYYKSMVPFVDMFNHDINAQMRHEYDPKTKCFVVSTQQKWPKGAQICMNYGPVPNKRLLQLKGFVVLDNPYDEVEIVTSMSPDAPEYSAKSRMFEHLGIPPIAAHNLNARELNPQLIASMRISRATPEDLPNAHNALQNKMISPENERTVCEALSAAIRDMLAEYPPATEDKPYVEGMKAQMAAAQSQAAIAAKSNGSKKSNKKGGKKKGGSGKKKDKRELTETSNQTIAETLATATIEEGTDHTHEYRMQCIAVLRDSERNILLAQLRMLSEARLQLET